MDYERHHPIEPKIVTRLNVKRRILGIRRHEHNQLARVVNALDGVAAIGPGHDDLAFHRFARTVHNQYIAFPDTITRHAVTHRPYEVGSLLVGDTQIV